MRKMKDSGIEWIGDIPVYWEKYKLKDYYMFEKGKRASLYTKTYIGENPGEYPVYSGQTENDGIMGKINSFDYDIDECIFTTTVGAHVMTPKILEGKFSLSQNCLIMKKIKKCNNHFVYYILLPLFNYKKSMIPSYMQPSLRISDLSVYDFYLPPLEEQKLIVDYLDNKVKEVDNIILKTKETIGEYKKYKKSVITEAVTKGLNPNVKMKYSGIEWIGEIPVSWNIIRTKNKYTSSKEIVGTRVDDFERLSLTLNGVIKRTKDDSEGLQPEKFEGYQILRENELVFKLIDLENVKTSRVGLSLYTGIVSPAYIVLNNKYESKFGYYYFLSMWQREIFNKLGGDGVRSNLNTKDLLNIPYIDVPIDEQREIANYLDNKVSKIDNLILKKQELITQLEQYKKSLIYEYVTGKKEINKDTIKEQYK